MRWKYPTFEDWFGEYIPNIGMSRGDFLDGSGADLRDAWNTARETVDDADLDQPATYEWVRGREGWETCANIKHTDCQVLGRHIVFNRVFYPGVGPYMHLSVGGIIEDSPTRKQVIAAENFAKEMGWV